MPETPDLIVIRRYLQNHILGAAIDHVVEHRPLALRVLQSGATAEQLLVGRAVESVSTRAKFLVIGLDGMLLVINFMLAGALRHCERATRLRKRDYVTIGLSDGMDLRYYDPKGMGKVYVTDVLTSVPGLDLAVPDALDPALTLDLFRERLERYRGEVKGVLTRGAWVGGIGNAYADEILFAAGIFPFVRVTRLTDDQVADLYQAMRTVLLQAVDVLIERMGDRIDVKVRDFLQVHGHSGEPCPRCGGQISEIKSRQRATHFCRTCQPGSLLRGF